MEKFAQQFVPSLSRLTTHIAARLGVTEKDVLEAFESFTLSLEDDEVTELCAEVVTTVPPVKEIEVWIGKYSDKEFIVGGDTKTTRDTLKKRFDGKWKPFLDRVQQVWMFSSSNHDKVKEYLEENCTVTEDNQYYKKSIVPSRIKKQPLKVSKTKDGHFFDKNTGFLFESVIKGKVKSLRCIGYREEINGETMMLTKEDVEKIKKMGCAYDSTQIDNNEEDEDYDLRDDKNSEGEEDGNYND